ncbi:hypothetical protein [Polyangium sp. 15x6]|uniref:hypothetical protein n=1 Tax=Polyangium sp. 15x6 TaxID=3042687 RepID=UPI00249BD8F0|nr:hypothetical protein [Polyangium sp. 15x6]MDI3282564.1 hypothetical protein [Polyangium sp. 15x6]
MKPSIPSLPIVLMLGALGCASAPPPPVATSAPPVTTTAQEQKTAEPPSEPPPPPPAPTPKVFGYRDFLSIAGVRARATLDDVEAAWGKGERKSDKIRYKDGPTVSVMPSGGLMIDIHLGAADWVKEHADGPLSIWGKTCEEAAAALDFTDSVGAYTTCKHYEKDLFLDVTLMCSSGRVSTIAVVWYPFSPADAVNPLPPDHCR